MAMIEAEDREADDYGGKTVSVSLTEILERFDADADHDQDNRTEALSDFKFRAGEQWPTNVIQERQAENRPVVTVNRTGQFIRQVTGDLRKNPPSIRIRPVGDGADSDTARVIGGIIRKIEQNSDAQNAYITAIEHAATGGLGHWRVLTQYSQWDVFEQDVVVEAIQDPFAVTWDRMANKPTREDASHCFVSEWVSPEVFEAMYPDASPVSFEDRNFTSSAPRAWLGDNAIRVAEYWFKRKDRRLLALMPDGKTVDITDLDPMQRQGLPIVRAREAEVDCVYWCKTNGIEILDKPRKWAGRYIPIVPVIGEEINTGERIVRQGLIRPIKDAQRLYNYARSAEAEVVALQPRAPFVATQKQVAKHWDMWKSANKKNYAALIYDADPQAPGPPQRVMPPVASQALAQMAMTASDDMKATTGIYDASLGARSNETSGVAIRARQAEGDTGTFVFSDNLARSMRHSARIMLDLIPKIYDTERTMIVLHDDDSVQEVTLNQTVMVEGEEVVLYDVTLGKYDVEVTVGPTYATRRAEAVESMMGFLQANPAAAPLIADLVAKNSDWPGAENIARRLRKAIPPQILEGEKTDDEDAAMPPADMQGPPGGPGPAPTPGAPGAAPSASGPAAPAADAGPSPIDVAERDAKLGLEAQKVDNDRDYKMATLELEQRRVAIEAFKVKLQALQQAHAEGIALRQQDLAEIEALSSQIGAMGEAGDPALQSLTDGQPQSRVSDLIASVQAFAQQVAAVAAAPRRVVVQRDPVTGLITELMQVPMAETVDAQPQA
jgi:hypothetical protein